MSGGPAYYRPEKSPEHVHLGTGYHLAVEAMLRTLKSSKAFAPLGVYMPWAKQNGAIHWTTIENPDHEVVIYPIAASTIDRVNQASYGCEVPWVAVLTQKPVQAIVAEQAWDATRYDLFEVEAVYDVDDNRPAPRICFLYWAKLHEDVGGGRQSLDTVATRLGGTLVFPVQLAIIAARQKPPLPFQMVLDAQLAAASMPAAATPSPAVRTPAAATGSFEPSGLTPWLLAAGAGGILWSIFGRRKRKAL